jgi:hypothetical protein
MGIGIGFLIMLFFSSIAFSKLGNATLVIFFQRFLKESTEIFNEKSGCEEPFMKIEGSNDFQIPKIAGLTLKRL